MITIALMFLGVVLAVALCATAFFLGNLYQTQKQLTLESHFTLITSMMAAYECQGLKKSTIIQRIVEKYTPTNPLSAEEMKARMKVWEDELESEVDGIKKKRGNEQVWRTLEPDDLV